MPSSSLRDTTGARRLRGPLRTLLLAVVPLLLVELLLRGCGLPRGRFAALLPSEEGVYPRRAVLQMDWGVIPYVVRTNSLGLRGEEIARDKPPGRFRIVTVGDSLTDGFFVDNEATWQYRLEALLRERLGDVEVVNCAHGGGSIDKQLFLLRRHGLPLQPDLVILTFATNDVSDILGRPREALVSWTPQEAAWPPTAWATGLLLRSAVGETALDAILRVRSPEYRQRDERLRRAGDRYTIPGGDAFDRNTVLFARRTASSDGLLLGASFAPAARRAFDDYLFVLAAVADDCRRSGARLLLVDFPAYSQVYGGASRLANDELASACRRLDAGFLDLTDGFVQAGRSSVLHLAPLDFHPNPAGQRLVARLLAERLLADNASARSGGALGRER